MSGERGGAPWACSGFPQVFTCYIPSTVFYFGTCIPSSPWVYLFFTFKQFFVWVDVCI
eukprot:NODE_12702_length_204_cov_9.541935_g11961_i0.p4 GENE.NODE_12702_length_204_cov_9.541935_g11961_i0~~NODE_12702_length_204_cov_9.541935_g11961_i0.p4  ORF type:complete len:58 (-),score=0.48 NODE_12702_length_204_cov_9.541935_g11961_i0:1-174(-)